MCFLNTCSYENLLKYGVVSSSLKCDISWRGRMSKSYGLIIKTSVISYLLSNLTLVHIYCYIWFPWASCALIDLKAKIKWINFNLHTFRTPILYLVPNSRNMNLVLQNLRFCYNFFKISFFNMFYIDFQILDLRLEGLQNCFSFLYLLVKLLALLMLFDLKWALCANSVLWKMKSSILHL